MRHLRLLDGRDRAVVQRIVTNSIGHTEQGKGQAAKGKSAHQQRDKQTNCSGNASPQPNLAKAKLPGYLVARRSIQNHVEITWRTRIPGTWREHGSAENAWYTRLNRITTA